MCLGFAQLVGCEGVGAVCYTSGSVTECGDEKICTFWRAPTPAGETDPNATLPPPVNLCLRQCDSAKDCGDGELCRVVYCSTLKSCQPGPLEDPPPNICGAGGAGGMGGGGGEGGVAGTGGTGGTGGSGGTGGTSACNSEARAYVQTLDPNSGFNRTNFVPFDTTNLPDTWDRYSISLDLTDPLLEGQIVQFGFTATASNYEPSGMFYDNVLVETGTEAGGGGGAGGSGDLDLVTDYTQDFESLDQASPTALGDNPIPPWGPGWIVFANVFDPAGEALIYTYGPDPAPNNTGAFSGIALDQGGVEQGDQQLVIISDYNNADQGAGRRIEANTFRERNIGAADIGKTLVFSFDANRGNINEGCPPPSEP